MPIPEFSPEATKLGEILGELFWVYQLFAVETVLPENKEITAERILDSVTNFFRTKEQAGDYSEAFLAKYELMTSLNE